MGLFDSVDTALNPAGLLGAPTASDGFGGGKGGSQGMSAAEIDALIKTQARVNRVDQVTPTGSLTFSGKNRNTATTTLTPEQQALLEQLQSAQLRGGGVAEDRLGQLAQGRDAVQQATFDRALGLLSPELDRREAALHQRLANQGLPQASRAFGAEVGRFEDTSNRALQELALSSVLAGGAEETRMAQLALGLLTGAQPAGVPLISTPEITVPINEPGGSMSPLQGALGGAATGAGTGATFGPWGALIGAGAGGLLGYGAVR